MLNNSFNNNLFKSKEICNNFLGTSNISTFELNTTEEGYFYSKFNSPHKTFYVIYKNPKIINLPKFIILCHLVNSKKIIFFKHEDFDIHGESYVEISKFDIKTEKITKISTFKHRNYLRGISISRDGKLALFSDSLENVILYSIQKSKIIKSKNFMDSTNNTIKFLHLSPDKKIILCIKQDKIIFWKEDNVKYNNFDSTDCYDCKICFTNDIIKIVFSNGIILYLKNGELTCQKNLNLDRKWNNFLFSKSGKILCRNNKNIFKFIHEDADEYSNEISFIEHKGHICKEEKFFFEKNPNHVCEGYISPDEKFFFVKNRNKITSYDLSFIGYKKCQRLQFLCGTKDKISSINSFSENVIFDINLLTLIFDFLPFSKELKN